MHFRVLGCGKILGTVYGQERLKPCFCCIASIHIILIICGSKKRHWTNHYLFTSHSPLRPPLISSLNPHHPPNLQVFPNFPTVLQIFPLQNLPFFGPKTWAVAGAGRPGRPRRRPSSVSNRCSARHRPADVPADAPGAGGVYISISIFIYVCIYIYILNYVILYHIMLCYVMLNCSMTYFIIYIYIYVYIMYNQYIYI